MNGKQLSAIGKEIMEAAGWVRLWCANSPRPLPKTMKGLSDNGWVRDGVLLFIEDKGDNDTVSDAQMQFQFDIYEHAPLNVLYLVAESVEDYEKFVNIRKVLK